jgi:hypothetical protein
MSLQFIHDNKGNTTGVFIPIDDWQSLKSKYLDLQKEEVLNFDSLAQWQKSIVDQRLSDYYKTDNSTVDFDQTIDEIEKTL